MGAGAGTSGRTCSFSTLLRAAAVIWAAYFLAVYVPLLRQLAWLPATAHENLHLVHPADLAAAPASSCASGDVSEACPVPRILHITWKTATIPERFQEARAKCEAANPGWETKLWTDDSARAFLAENYPWFLPTWDAYPHGVMRADAIRYFVIYHFGGVYADLDLGCAQGWDPLRALGLGFHVGFPFGVSTELLVARPRHPFWAQILTALPEWGARWWGPLKYLTVFLSTGPVFVSIHLGKLPWGSDARVLTKDAFDAYTLHYPGRTWFTWDVQVISCIGDTISEGLGEALWGSGTACTYTRPLVGKALLVVAAVAGLAALARSRRVRAGAYRWALQASTSGRLRVPVAVLKFLGDAAAAGSSASGSSVSGSSSASGAGAALLPFTVGGESSGASSEAAASSSSGASSPTSSGSSSGLGFGFLRLVRGRGSATKLKDAGGEAPRDLSH